VFSPRKSRVQKHIPAPPTANIQRKIGWPAFITGAARQTTTTTENAMQMSPEAMPATEMTRALSLGGREVLARGR